MAIGHSFSRGSGHRSLFLKGQWPSVTLSQGAVATGHSFSRGSGHQSLFLKGQWPSVTLSQGAVAISHSFLRGSGHQSLFLKGQWPSVTLSQGAVAIGHSFSRGSGHQSLFSSEHSLLLFSSFHIRPVCVPFSSPLLCATYRPLFHVNRSMLPVHVHFLFLTGCLSVGWFLSIVHCY